MSEARNPTGANANNEMRLIAKVINARRAIGGLEPRPIEHFSLDPAGNADLERVRLLDAMTGPLVYDAEAIARLTGVAVHQIEAWTRLGIIAVCDGRVWSIR